MPSRLKSLELQGYKTFANRTPFEFANTVTAIVGPNGSGKSNIADSLRWVLGEQSYSLLRGRKTEDMIFSGSESRPRASMASASITFDNSDDWLPIDFSEVSIARRAYRDGQNEYLINGQRVRLKDVSELLARSGLAERTYTVIGQGLVDAALSLKAEERRRLFEEAAGIGLYRSRREEALRRLATTQRNLDRVQDILAELRPRLRSLERQAQRARQHEQIKTDLRVLLREFYGYHWHRAQNELSEARQAAQVQEDKLNISRKEQNELDERLAALRQRIQSLRTDLNAWHRESSQLHARRETLSRYLAVAAERERALGERKKSTQAEIAGLNQELALRHEELSRTAAEVTELRTDLEERRAQAEQARQALTERQRERTQAERNIQSTRSRLSKLNAQQGQLQARLTERQTQAKKTLEALEITSERLKEAKSRQQETQTRLKTTQQAETQAAQARQEAQTALDEHRQRLSAAENQRRAFLEKRSAAAADLASLQARLEVLDQAESSLSGYASGTRVLLEAARQGRLAGAQGALSSQLEVPAKLEKAIAAALGEYLDAVLLSANLEDALDLLNDQTGRGVLLPIQELKPPEVNISDPKADEQILGLASQLVRASEQLRPVLDLLLGRTLVAANRQAARRALSNRSDGWRAVTLQGEVFFASGPVRTSGGRSGENTLLGRTRQRRELNQLIAATQEQLANLDQRLKKLDADIKNLGAQQQKLDTSLKKRRQAWEQSRTNANRARDEVEQAKRQVRWQVDEQQRLQAEIVSGEKQAKQFQQQLSELETSLTQTRQDLRSQNAHLAALNLDEFQAQVSHWNTLSAVAEQALSGALARQKDRRTTLERLKGNLRGLENRLEKLENDQDMLETERRTQRQDEAQIGGQIKSLGTLIEPAEAEIGATETEQTNLQEEASAARQKLSQAEHFHAQTRITLARKQEALETLQRRIEDDLGLVAYEYDEQISGPTPLPLEGMVEQLPSVESLTPEMEETIKRQRAQLRRIGAINPEAQAEHEEVKQRFVFLNEQVADLNKAEVDIRQVIKELDTLMQREFRKTFEAVAGEFRGIFTRLFGGGSARLVLTDPDDLTQTGIDIEARLPGRRTQGLSLLSGGERSLTATALIFSLLKISPTPFCVLDEVDAMLDEMNVGRFRELLRELSQNTQFVIVTHNRNTVQVADVIYGITMGRDSASQVLSLRLDEVSQIIE